MLFLVGVLMVLLTTAVIVYPFFRPRRSRLDVEEDSTLAELDSRWEAVAVGLRDAEMERAIGTLPEEEYQWLRRQYMAEAAAVLRAAEMEEEQEQAILADIEKELQRVRQQAQGGHREDGRRGGGHETPAREVSNGQP